MVNVHPAGPVERPQLGEHLLCVLVIVGALEIGLGPGGKRHACAVGQDVPDRGAVLAVAGVAGQVFAHSVVEGEHSLINQHVDHGRGNALGGRIHAEGCVRRDGDLFGVGGIGRGVAPAVADGAVEDDAPVLPDAQLDRRMHAGPVPVPCRLPDPLDGGFVYWRVDFGVVFFTDYRHGVQVYRHPDLAVLRRVPHSLRAYVAANYSPVNCGGRLANVAEMPSVRSLDGRKAAFQAAT